MPGEAEAVMDRLSHRLIADIEDDLACARRIADNSTGLMMKRMAQDRCQRLTDELAKARKARP